LNLDAFGISGDTKCYRSRLTRVSSGLLAERTRKVSFKMFWCAYTITIRQPDICIDTCERNETTSIHTNLRHGISVPTIPMGFGQTCTHDNSSCGYQRALSDLSLLPYMAVCNCSKIVSTYPPD